MTKKKTKIELLTTCFGWEEGHITTVKSEDNENYYFDDERGRWSVIEKSKDGIVFKVIGKQYPDIKCGGKEVTYNNLRKRVKELENGHI
jgi:hypothetical protein